LSALPSRFGCVSANSADSQPRRLQATTKMRAMKTGPVEHDASSAVVSHWLNAGLRRMVSERDAICRSSKDLAHTGAPSFAVITISHSKPFAPNCAAYN
jgi:hypothetical protein